MYSHTPFYLPRQPYGTASKWALRQSRPRVSEKLVNDLLDGKRVNPLSGVAGLHLLLLNESIPWGLFGKVLGKLYNLIGLHPDVAALAMVVPEDSLSNLLVAL